MTTERIPPVEIPPELQIADNRTGPHEFVPLKRFFNRDRCAACYRPESEHPLTGWTKARPLGDTSR